jgi:NAD(P)-dependent dehydrogenase (short-subunit alcohol dehydrogenase family)
VNVVVTGANRGLGLELTRAWAGRGDTVVAGCRDPDGARVLRGLTPHAHAVDMESEASIATFASAAAAHGPVDVLVNNAGLDATGFGVPDGERDVLTLSADNVLREMAVNALGPMLLTRALLPAVRASDNGRIVNVTSQVASMEVAARMGRDIGYTTSKAALNMISVKLAARLRADGITVIALHPGYLRTDMGGPSADLDPADAAAAIVRLVDGLTVEQSGRFLRWDGTVHPW